MNSFVQVKNLSKEIGNKPIIKDVSFELFPGKITGFLGPNGAGKTTTIRMMTGLMKPTSGDVFINEYSIQQDYEKAIQPVGVIVENPEMYGYLSGYKNLLHFARMQKNVTKQQIDAIIEQVGMTARIHEKVSTYSLGMRQRLGLAQALLHNPKFLILDEPTNGLDPAGIKELRQQLRTLAEQQGVTILVSSHLLSEIELMCDRVVIIQNGVIIEERDLKETQETIYAIETEQAAAQLFDTLQLSFEQKENYFFVQIEKEAVPSLIKELVAANIAVYSVQPHHTSLEEQFLQVTGGVSVVKSNA